MPRNKLKKMELLKNLFEKSNKLKKMRIKKKKKITLNPKGLLKSVVERNKKFRELMKALDDK